jgi:hypothetical protein
MFNLSVQFLSLDLALQERNTGMTSSLLFAVLFGFLLIGLARLSYPNLFSMLFKNFIRVKPIDNSFGEEVKISLGTSMLLNFNFIFSLGLTLFLLAKNQLEIGLALSIAAGGAITYFAINQLGFRLVSFVFGESKLIDNLSFISSSLLNFGGVFLLVLGLIWSLNPEFSQVLSLVLICFLGVFYIIRIFKGLNITFRQKISWYYLILYLCTVEILPVLIVSRIIWLKFQ